MPEDISTFPPTATVETKTTTVESTTQENGPGTVSKDSRIFGVSIMAWTLLMLIITICYCQVLQVPLYDHMLNLSLIAIGFYAGRKTS